MYHIRYTTLLCLQICSLVLLSLLVTVIRIYVCVYIYIRKNVGGIGRGLF